MDTVTRNPLDDPLVPGRADVTWHSIRAEFHQKRSPHLIREAAKHGGLPHREVTGLVEQLIAGEPDPPTGPGAVETLGRFWAAAAEREKTFLLAFLLYAECQWAWERVDESERLRAALRTIARSRAGTDPAAVPAAGAALTDVLIGHLGDLAGFIAIENGVNCSCPQIVGETAGAVLARTRSRLRALDALAGAAPPAEATVLRGLLEVHERYATGMGLTSAAVLHAVDVRPGSPEWLPGSVRRLSEAGAELARLRRTPLFREDVYASELRAHQRAMAALADRLSTGTLGRLRLDGLTATYIVPFTIRGASDTALVAALDRLDTRAEGLWPRLVDETDLSDLWNLERTLVLPSGDADHEARRGRSLILPELRIVDTARQEHTGFTVEVRLNAVGNHYLRIEGRYPEPTFHSLNQLIRRGTDFMGSEDIFIGDRTEPFPTLSALAGEVVGRLLPGWAAEVGLPAVTARLHPAVDAHVLVVIDGATVATPDGGEREATGADLIEALGPLLVVPAERTATSFEDWVYLRDPAEPAAAGVLGEHAPRGSLAVQNSRVTTFYLPGEPDWRMLEFVEMVEFAVSVPALARRWLDEVQTQIDTTIVRMDRGPADGPKPARVGRLERLRRGLTGDDPEQERIDSIEDLRVRIARKSTAVRRLRAGLYSVELTRSSAHRDILDRMIAATGVDRVVADITARTDQLDRLYDRLGSQQRSAEERRSSAYSQLTYAILFVVGLFSFADVIGLVNSLYFTPGVPGPRIAVETGLFVVVIAGLAWWAFSRGRDRDPDRR